ncbi:PrsW family glutamic-type intramembrane protease [Streptococcus sp. HMSC057G03]|uniref:PrsW family glutamic-type intramembrane protease n=1 Tax=Streptococcus sp. HMSC057G03 TaxID=1715165 RepID=UPI0008A45DC8|nr:PrsW family glutamic-type intramembrane protease [Streptococcus sp. HMSC057G03]MDU7553391.1 PrsW family glutamic-type intramembrane protease [Streptococcus parasanguinis]OFN94010.1 beta-carotene 15,15'-monooxygenase [Streptococcus sp. HMSC057G03]
MTKIQRASIYLFLLFAGIGLEFELGHLSQQEFSQSAGRDLVLNLSVLAAIIIPLYLFSKRLAKQLSVPTYLLWIAMFGGAFVAGWLSFSGNSLIDIMNSHVIKDATVFNKWTDALTAPFSEEFFKALVAFWVVLMVGKKDLKTILIAGLGSGFGFQIIEDLGYVARQTKTSQLAAVTEAINRISGGLASHALYTAVVSVGVFLLLSQVTQQKEKLFGLWCVLSTVANHFLWNSPFYETDHRINLLVGLLFAVQVGTFIEVVLYTKKHPELPFLKQ